MQGLEPFPRKELEVGQQEWSYLDNPVRLTNLEKFLNENSEAVIGDSISILERYVSKTPTTLLDSHMDNSNSVWGAVKETY